MRFRGTAIVQKEEEWFVATCIENNIASQGKSIDSAVENLKEAISLYYEDQNSIPQISEYKPPYITMLEMAV